MTTGGIWVIVIFAVTVIAIAGIILWRFNQGHSTPRHGGNEDEGDTGA